MRMNVGKLDVILRVIGGSALIVSAYVEYIGPWGWIGLVPLLTAIVGWCPAYAILGIKTCPLSKGE